MLQALGDAEIPFAIATSGRLQSAAPALETLRFDFTDIPIVTRDDVKYAKPDPDLFLRAAERLKVGADAVSVVGDSVWDMLAATRARFLGIGLLSGGYGLEELERSGAYRVFADPADMLRHLDEVGRPAVNRPDVRDAGEDEIDQLATVWCEAWRDAHAHLMPVELTRVRTWESFRSRLEEALPNIRVTGPPADPTGFCIIKGDELYQLFVAAHARGSGAAVALIG